MACKWCRRASQKNRIPYTEAICGRHVDPERGDGHKEIYLCTRSKGHKGPCVACVSFSSNALDHELAFKYEDGTAVIGKRDVLV